MANNRRRRKRSQKQGWKRLWRKGISALLLVLLILAFLRIQKKKKAGGSGNTENGGNTGPGQVQETHTNVDVQGDPIYAGDPTDSADSEDLFTLDMVPPYSGKAYADINGDVPFFTEEEAPEAQRTAGTQGPDRCRKPTGWNTNRYDDIDGEMLFNRCHLIGHLLTGQDANERNLVTGTRYMNVEGMLPFEESVVMYVEGTGHHVMYRVRPYFDGDDLVCSGVLMEAKSVEDPRVQFCAFCYNVQPGITIDYATGGNWRTEPQ